MFPKGPRFEQLKGNRSSTAILVLTPASASDVPGPGTYNPTDTVENYKRGAFLEKTDRFAKDPCHYLPSSCISISFTYCVPLTVLDPDRYVALQKKVEDLEKLHLQEKKSVSSCCPLDRTLNSSSSITHI
jgi:hypothetical protein